ncbi:MAG: LysM peptidoglycan-binding domain-containing protein [Chloroflexi bacterium]|nr:LysM peptidoglycan-binding domain-containing protein [Chloroflexota bacterium]
MKTRTGIFILAIATALVFGIVLDRPASVVLAGQPAQSAARTPTEEPTKPPYVFPTPIFIPTTTGNNPIAPTKSTPAATPNQPASGGTQPSGERTYVVAPGDSAWVIAQKVYGKNNGPKYELILSANNLTATSRLQVGQVLKIPPLSGAEPPVAQPTAAAVTAPPTAAATARPSTPLPTSVSNRKAAEESNSNSATSSSRFEIALMALNLLSGILLTGAVVFGFLSYTMYQRARRLEKITIMTRRIRAY